jgi:heme-degrading monooxygenase HmoA
MRPKDEWTRASNGNIFAVPGGGRRGFNRVVGSTSIAPPGTHLALHGWFVVRRPAREVAVIVVESRFRVANGMEEEVRTAFLTRPRLVDHVCGFLGMEVFQAATDPAVFHLVTRWTDRETYDTWHRGDDHQASHAFIPRGLKLEAGFTQVTMMNRVEPVGALVSLETALGDAAPPLARWITEASAACAALIFPDGTLSMNGALAERIGTLSVAALRDVLANDEAGELVERIAEFRAIGDRGPSQGFLLNFVSASQSPFTLRCIMDVQRGYALLVGEDVERVEDQLRDQLLHSNNQLAVLARDREQQRQALQATHHELARVHTELASTLEALDKSHWHIRRIQEVLPVCMECGDVKSDVASWQSAREFLATHALRPFLSHGYCPACIDRVMTRLDDEDTA